MPEFLSDVFKLFGISKDKALYSEILIILKNAMFVLIIIFITSQFCPLSLVLIILQ